MKDILYFNTLEDIKIVDMLRTTSKDSKEQELPNLIILTILSAGEGVGTPIFSKDASGTTVFASINEIGTKFILDGKEVTSDDFLVTTGNITYFGLQFKDSNEHTLKVSLVNSTINQNTFKSNNYLTKVIIGTSITSIGNSAFYGCSGLTSITIPNSVTTIGDWAFSGCTGLATVTIPNSVTEIGSDAFHGCTNLTTINLSNSVTEIGERAFMSCTKLTSITIPDSVTSISDNTFTECNRLASVTIGNSVTSIGKWVFAGCAGLTSITSLAITAPTISNTTFDSVNSGGTLHVPAGSDYSAWMATSDYYLGKYNWTKVEDA